MHFRGEYIFVEHIFSQYMYYRKCMFVVLILRYIYYEDTNMYHENKYSRTINLLRQYMYYEYTCSLTMHFLRQYMYYENTSTMKIHLVRKYIFQDNTYPTTARKYHANTCTTKIHALRKYLHYENASTTTILVPREYMYYEKMADLGGSVGCASAFLSGGRGFDLRRVLPLIIKYFLWLFSPFR